MVITEFNIVGITLSPAKTYPPLIIDTNAVLTLPITGQSFQAVPRRAPQILQVSRFVDHGQLAPGRVGDIRRSPFGAKAGENRSGPLVGKGPDHRLNVPGVGTFRQAVRQDVRGDTAEGKQMH